ncbi:hypothetical protein SRABI118_01173 [Massilia sp. Bi118]|uniref:hypothetical protein n=1 Tax=Massilia sp. Bi118 TaxID=2822346 RepID=UPI001D37B491|nr:hypothetical protein [Massilia sp. Bi118]CAH0178476.1 hypothetical protein SRABI118_01173 [Massilia sp. Bi118]
MSTEKKLQFDELMQLATTSAAVTRDCDCAIDACREWTRIPAGFPEQQMQTLGTLVEDPYIEATYEEYHPAGTNYWSAEAPIAWRHYPYNRCSVLQCEVCGRCCLKYVEAGGYYVEPRMRALDPRLLVNLPADA